MPNKPPVGLTPRYIFLEQRITDIEDAIKRYMHSEAPLPVEWVIERNQILAELGRR